MLGSRVLALAMRRQPGRCAVRAVPLLQRAKRWHADPAELIGCTLAGLGSSRASTSLMPVRPTAFQDNYDQVSLSERQEAVLIERLPRLCNEEEIRDTFERAGVDLGDDWRDKVLVMRSRLGVSFGRALIATPEHVPHVKRELPHGVVYKQMDRYEVEAFVEQCERLVNLSDDLRRLAMPENFERVVTITEVPPLYGRQDIAYILQNHCGITVDLKDIVFRFKRWGRQSDTCYVVCPTVKEADHCISLIQELAVPKRAAYGSLFGATFLWSSRATMFISSAQLDFLVHDSKFWICTTGWQNDLQEPEFLSLLARTRIIPNRAVKFSKPEQNTAMFFMRFDNMKRTKQAMVRLRKLKWRWRIKRETPFFAYPRRVDIHQEGEDCYEDEDSASDSEIDEPVEY